jgi:hypothetical protein
MHITYELTAEDYRHALIAYRNSSFLRRWMIVFLALFFALLVVIQGYLASATSHQPWLRWSLLLTVMIIAMLLWLQWGALYANARRQFWNTPSSQERIALDVQDTGLHFRSASTDGTVSWKRYIKWIEEKHVFVLFSSPLIFVIVPKRAFAAEQLLAFRETLRQKIPV